MGLFVKICGLTRLRDVEEVVECGPDAIGFVFWSGSPRCVDPEEVGHWTRHLRRKVLRVGVFVDEEPDAVQQIVTRGGLDCAQLHGAEPPETADTLMAQEIGIIKAFRIRDGASLAEIARYRATAYLLDAYLPGQPGGTGQTFDWTLAARVEQHGPVILAGGLTPDNVARAVHTVRPWGLDVASGVEAAPGRKDHDKVRRFIRAARM